METVMGSGITIALLAVFLIMGMPIGFALLTTGFIGYWLLAGLGPAIGLLASVPYGDMANYAWLVLPLFIFMAELLVVSGLSRDLFDAAGLWLRRTPGGMAQAAVLASAIFAAMCGSSTATAAAIGGSSIPEMTRRNYDRRLVVGSVAAGGTLGILIPPSNAFILYGIVTETSIGKLLIAGIVPGILLTLAFMATIALKVIRNPGLAPPLPMVSKLEKMLSLKRIVPVIFLFVLIIGSIYFGIATANEAAAVGVLGAFVIALIRGKLNWNNFCQAMANSAKMSSMILVIILGASFFSYFLAISQMPQNLSNFIMLLDVSQWVILAIICLAYLVLGCFLDVPAMVLLTMPIVFPTIVGLGFDPVWFGVLFVMLAEIGLLTPPVGLNLFVIKAVAPETPFGEIVRGVLPFILVQALLLVLIMVIPTLALWLPNTMK